MLIRMNYQKVKTATFPLTFPFLPRRANSWIIRELGRVLNAKKSRRRHFAQAQSFLSKDNLRTFFSPYPFASSRELVDNSQVRTSPKRQKRRRRHFAQAQSFLSKDNLRTFFSPYPFASSRELVDNSQNRAVRLLCQKRPPTSAEDDILCFA